MITMRQAVAADAAAVRALTREAYQKWVAVTGREPLPMRVDYDEALAKNRFDLLEEEGVLIALIETLCERGQFLIVNVAVAPAHQSRGLGRRLLAHAEQLALAAGCREVRLYTNSLMAPNIALYRRLGYRIDREEDEAPRRQVHMSKALS
ncbi:MAG TPA: GNAT family N-acetyltransferase [Reyranella sp.]|jgi:ribosomal protein S18 acetylase RimI-like enzyme|nr:GNAT family N-acetyltransferase [Reyranella sp.]